jgi:hypothetical protein
LNWYRQEISGQQNCLVSNITETGFTVIHTESTEGTVVSPEFPIEAEKTYKIDIDIIGDNWDVYLFICNEKGEWLHHNSSIFDDNQWRFSSNGTGNVSRLFTIP